MPHFYARKIDNLSYPISKDGFIFALCASNIKHSDESLILVRYARQSLLLTRQNKEKGVLVKYNRHLQCHQIDVAKRALQVYMGLGNADILSHNLNQKRHNVGLSDKAYLLPPTKEHITRLYRRASRFEIEIGFGSGRHLLYQAVQNKSTTFLGIEIYRPSIEQVLHQIDLLGIDNVYIIHADCRILFSILDLHVADAVYLHFPVPWDKNPQKRVFSKVFLEECQRVLKKGAFLELRSDSETYIAYALEIARDFSAFDIEKSLNAEAKIISKYEARWHRQQKDIYEVRFTLRDSKDCANNVESRIDIYRLDMAKILDSGSLKLFGEGYFLHIKNIYRFEGGYLLFVLFGAFYAPSKIYLLLDNYGNVEVLGDIINTEANAKSLRLIQRWSK